MILDRWEPTPHQIVVQGRVITGPLTQGDYEAMTRNTRCWRDTLLLMLLRNTGFRPIEIQALQVGHIDRNGPMFWLYAERAKKRYPTADILFLNPELGHPLEAYIRGEKLGPTSLVFNIKTRQIRNIVGDAGLRAIGRPVQPKEFRRFYIRTVAQIAAQVLGWDSRHMEVAQKMIGHESVRTTWDWYFELTLEERRQIQERVPV